MVLQPESDAINRLKDTTKKIESVLQSAPSDNAENPSPTSAKAKATLSKLYVSRRCGVLCTRIPCAFAVGDPNMLNSQRAKIANTKHELETKVKAEDVIINTIAGQVRKYRSGFEAKCCLCPVLRSKFGTSHVHA